MKNWSKDLRKNEAPMSSEEAIEILERISLLGSLDMRIKCEEAISMAIEAIIKTTPRRLIVEDLGDKLSYSCPYCKETLYTLRKNNVETITIFGHCPNCDQLLEEDY